MISNIVCTITIKFKYNEELVSTYIICNKMIDFIKYKYLQWANLKTVAKCQIHIQCKESSKNGLTYKKLTLLVQLHMKQNFLKILWEW